MSVEISEAEFESILVEKRQLSANLTACQKLCNEQLLELRALRESKSWCVTCAYVQEEQERGSCRRCLATNMSLWAVAG